MNHERYHLTLTADGRPVMHGWWADEQVARRKLTGWIGEYASMPGARVALVDEEKAVVLTSWPDEP